MFYPDSAGIGLHELIYSYTDAVNCTNTDSIFIYVDLCLAITVNDKFEMLIYPNPAYDRIFIQHHSLNSNFNFILSDVTGKVLIEKIFTSSSSIEELSLIHISEPTRPY